MSISPSVRGSTSVRVDATSHFERHRGLRTFPNRRNVSQIVFGDGCTDTDEAPLRRRPPMPTVRIDDRSGVSDSYDEDRRLYASARSGSAYRQLPERQEGTRPGGGVSSAYANTSDVDLQHRGRENVYSSSFTSPDQSLDDAIMMQAQRVHIIEQLLSTEREKLVELYQQQQQQQQQQGRQRRPGSAAAVVSPSRGRRCTASLEESPVMQARTPRQGLAAAAPSVESQAHRQQQQRQHSYHYDPIQTSVTYESRGNASASAPHTTGRSGIINNDTTSTSRRVPRVPPDLQEPRVPQPWEQLYPSSSPSSSDGDSGGADESDGARNTALAVDDNDQSPNLNRDMYYYAH